MRFSEEFLNELKYRSDIETVISSYVNLKRSGSTLKGLCPFHNEKTPSFTVYPQNGSYYCFGCGNGGDVVTFIRNAENLDYTEAVRFLADRAGMAMPETGYDDSQERLRRTILEINRESARFYYANLIAESGKKAMEYLRERAVQPETIRHFGLGFAPDSWDALCRHLKAKGYRDEDLILANIAAKGRSGKLYDRFRRKVMYPILDLRGNVIGFGGRKLPEDEGPKYLNTSDTPVFKKSRNMYALNFAKSTREEFMILAEGYMDVIALHQAGFTNAVAALGTAFTEEQAALLSRYTKGLVVTLDSDEAGQKATRRALEILKKTGLSIRVLQIEGGKDPDEYIRTYGAARFRLLLEGAGNEVEFQLLDARKKYDLSTDSGRLRFLTEAAGILSTFDDAITKDLYAGRLAQELSVGKQAILQEIDRKVKDRKKAQLHRQMKEVTKPAVQKDRVNPESAKNPRAAAAEETILHILMYSPEWIPKISDRLPPESFVTSFHRRVYEALLECTAEGRNFDLMALNDEFSTEEMGRIVTIQKKTGTVSGVSEQLEDCIRVLRQEKEKPSISDAGSMDDKDFEKAMETLRRQKGR